MPQVSVIIPVYKVEAYIEKCARSLFEQTLKEIEFIFIDDASPDKSVDILIKILEEYPERKLQVKIIRNKSNFGIASTRNVGLHAATGDFIIHCDSDDWVEPEMYKMMHSKAVEGDYDIVWCDYLVGDETKYVYKSQNCSKDPKEVVKALLKVLPPHAYNWNKLVRKNLYFDNKITFPDGINVQEDFIVTIQHFYYSSRVCHIPKALYFYRYREDSITRDKKKFEVEQIKGRMFAIDFVNNFFKDRGEYECFRNEINLKKLKFKSMLLSRVKNKKQWIGLFPEANKNLHELDLGFLTQLALRAASLHSVFGYTSIIKIKNVLDFLRYSGRRMMKT